MTLNLTIINYVAVLVAAAASFIVGALWYGAVFGKTWVRLYAYTDEQVQAMAKGQARAFVIFFIGDLVGALALAILLNNIETPSLLNGLILAFLLWAGVGATNAAMHKAAHRQSLATYAMDTGHHLLSLLVMGAILGAWR